MSGEVTLEQYYKNKLEAHEKLIHFLEIWKVASQEANRASTDVRNAITAAEQAGVDPDDIVDEKKRAHFG